MFGFGHIRAALEEVGLQALAAFAVDDGDAVPAMLDGTAAAALVLAGNAGSSLWPVFVDSHEYRDRKPDPLDRWSRRIGDALATRFGARALFPFEGPPFHPFQAWAGRHGALTPSPLGVLAHPRYGLWHAYRFALLLPGVPPDLPPPELAGSPCPSCIERPCLTSCPAKAVSAEGYRWEACIDHLRAEAPTPCRSDGCLARRACPAGASWRYEPAHARFHMDAFLAPPTLIHSVSGD